MKLPITDIFGKNNKVNQKSELDTRVLCQIQQNRSIPCGSKRMSIFRRCVSFVFLNGTNFKFYLATPKELEKS